ncbi:sucrase ferredoxin [Rhodococcus artemisiae]|uniref:Sucrase ferredoxin n=1 Tax=Rhodococcus artemisiae TaxID=714159 RepID=A0ABU7L8U8_9NOCA|nr:sucrase ferredoxin [Rhodococcus artemisiae]MEE2057976.1 sucrase ferredoxin [Rhodococcus artemisiae]
MLARAGRAQLWVLIEHPGPWPRSAPGDVLPDALVRRIESVGGFVRPALIRRPRDRTVVEPRWILAWSDGVRQWMREGTVGGYPDLVDLPFESSVRGEEPDVGVARHSPIFAVCTHGKKDACCAELGRPIVNAVGAVEGADVWECTHIGGDRFAANMIALPSGLYFSRLGPESAVVTAREVLSGRVPLGHLRGRAALSPSAQVAEHTLRERTGLDAIDAIEQVCETTTSEGSVAVDMRIAGRGFRVLVREGPPEPTFEHGCIVDSAVTWHRWIVDSIDESSPSDR